MDRPGHTDDQIKINGISTLRKRAEKRGFPKVQLSWIIISYYSAFPSTTTLSALMSSPKADFVICFVEELFLS
ncbi:hypothetical protein F4694_006190 [Bacillus niacini]|uniref:Uncharacterized protein n=1 Tax=Neobacillus niacini TaxID=86668 RepID=A0A852TLS8_9BACI|nr:hypothetical protein [Neobacillus niacini]NYE09319.1 hypothetical protein [Neobacillus niacini]